MAAPAQSPAGPQATSSRRRGEDLRSAIFDAVFELLESVGYAKLTMEAVAAYAHTGKAALYRRWASKEQLVAEALRQALPSPLDVPPADGVRADLLAQLQCLRAAFGITHGAPFQVVKLETNPNGGFMHSVMHERVTGPCEQMILEALGRGAARGEVRPDAVTPLVAGVGPAMLMHYSITQRLDISDEYLHEVLDTVLLPLIEPRTA